MLRWIARRMLPFQRGWRLFLYKKATFKRDSTLFCPICFTYLSCPSHCRSASHVVGFALRRWIGRGSIPVSFQSFLQSRDGIFKLLRSPGIDSASLCSQAGRHDNPIRLGTRKSLNILFKNIWWKTRIQTGDFSATFSLIFKDRLRMDLHCYPFFPMS